MSLDLPTENTERIVLFEDEEGSSLGDRRSTPVALLLLLRGVLHNGILLWKPPSEVLHGNLSGLVLVLSVEGKCGLSLYTESLLTSSLTLNSLHALLGAITFGFRLLVLVSRQIVHSDGQEDVEEDEVSGDEENDEVEGCDGPEALDTSVGLDTVIHHNVPVLARQDLQLNNYNSVFIPGQVEVHSCTRRE